MSGSKCGVHARRRSPIGTGTCILQTGDGGSTSEKQFVPGRIQVMLVIALSSVSGGLCTKPRCR